MAKKKTIQEVKQMFEKYGWKLLSTDYKDNKIPLEAICPNGHNTTKNYNNLATGIINCKICTQQRNGINQTIPLEEKRKIIEKEGYQLFGEVRNNSRKLALDICCNKGHRYKVIFNDFKKGHRCKKCKGLWADLKTTIEIIELNGWTYISGKYNNTFTKLKVKCPNNHIQKKSRADFKSKNSGCVHCLKRIQEKDCRTIFEKLFNKKFDCFWPDFLRNPKTNRRLQLDGYNKELKLAFEYDGKLHYVGYCGDRTLFEQKDRDLLKNQLCEKMGIILIRIPYFVKNKELFIKEELTKRGIYGWS